MDPIFECLEALREYMATAPKEELQARWARVKAENLPAGPTVKEYLGTEYQDALKTVAVSPAAFSLSVTSPSVPYYHFTNSLADRDVPAGEYSYAMAA